MIDYIIRDARPDDAQKMVDINLKTSWVTYHDLIPIEVLIQRTNERDKKISRWQGIDPNNNTFLVAEVDNEVVGFSGYLKSFVEGYENSGSVSLLYVLPKYQKYGIGKALYKTAIEKLVEKGFTDMTLLVIKGNPAFNFYTKFGGQYLKDIPDENRVVDTLIYCPNLDTVLENLDSKNKDM